jgi:predicted N-acetyltransferase YhbS/SAM-dependent methyltransferase
MTTITSPVFCAPVIRTAAPADHQAIRRVIEAAYREYQDELGPELHAAYLTNLLEFDDRGESVLLVAEVDGAIAGTVTLYPDASAIGFGWPAGWAAIRALAVDPTWRGHGIGRRLIEACIDRAVHASAIGLHTAALMTSAIALYERAGFRRDPDLDVEASSVLGIAGAPRLIAYRRESADTYALGRSAAETDRLILQNQIYSPITRQFLVTAGVTRGMTVLDLGSGAGDVALLLADLVGPSGRVVGVDDHHGTLDTARARVRAAGWSNVELRHGDVRSLDLPAEFDAVVGRWILMHVPDPVDVLRRARALLRPGGLVAFLESDLVTPVRTFPPAPLHQRVAQWTAPQDGVPGPPADMGLQLYRTFLDAGLPAPQLRLEAPIGGGPDWPGYAYIASGVRSLLPRLEQTGAVTAAEVDVDTLENRLRSEIVSERGVQILPTVIGAWSRSS